MTLRSSTFNKRCVDQTAFDKARVIDVERADICKLLIGFSVGATTALLLAPYPGKNTRSKITDAAADGTAYVKGRGETVRDAVLDVLEHGKVDIARHKQGLAEAIKRGSEAYKRVVSEQAIA
jgi:gas vesicle protein